LVVPFVLFLSLFCYFGSWSRFSTDGASVRRVFISSFQGIGVSVSMPAVVSGLSSGLHGQLTNFEEPMEGSVPVNSWIYRYYMKRSRGHSVYGSISHSDSTSGR